METATEKTDYKNKIERLVKEYKDEKADFNLEGFLQKEGITDLTTLPNAQRKQFAEDLVEKIIKPATSSGKSSMARVELMSILRINVEPWKITETYVPSPREYILAAEMKDEFSKLRRQSLYKEIVKYGLKDRTKQEPQTRYQVLNSVISDILGSMPKTTLLYAKEHHSQYPLEWTVNKSLTTYMPPQEAKESTKNLIQLVDTFVNKNPEEDTTFRIDEKELSNSMKNYFTDTNHLLLRKFKNENNIFNINSMREDQKQRMMYGIMTHYFGSMSQRFLRMEYDKLKLTEETGSADAEKLKLINAIIHDCLHSSMNPQDAKAAHKEIDELITP